MNDNIGLLINSSRGIIYASNGTDFAEKARAEALENATRNGGDCECKVSGLKLWIVYKNKTLIFIDA